MPVRIESRISRNSLIRNDQCEALKTRKLCFMILIVGKAADKNSQVTGILPEKRSSLDSVMTVL